MYTIRKSNRGFFSRIGHGIIDKAGLIGVLFVIGIVIGWAIGFGMNIYKVFTLTNIADHVGELIIRVLTIIPFWPLGGIVGWF